MFIELTEFHANEKFIINKSDILLITQYDNGLCFLETSLYNKGDFIKVKENYEEIKSKLIGELK